MALEPPSIEVTGGCLCGAVRYRATEPPAKGAYCHCRLCQKSYGGLFMAGLQFSRESFSFTKAKPRFFRSSKIAERGFCPDCGTPLVFRFDNDTEIWVLLGSLDRPDEWPLTKDAGWGAVVHTQTDSKVPWHVISDGLPQWTGGKFQQEALARSKLQKP
jgi:hypothetical protein